MSKMQKVLTLIAIVLVLSLDHVSSMVQHALTAVISIVALLLLMEIVRSQLRKAAPDGTVEIQKHSADAPSFRNQQQVQDSIIQNTVRYPTDPATDDWSRQISTLTLHIKEVEKMWEEQRDVLKGIEQTTRLIQNGRRPTATRPSAELEEWIGSAKDAPSTGELSVGSMSGWQN